MASKKIELTTEVVDAAKAEQWLDTMKHNRKLSTSNVNKLSALMVAGHWVFDGSPIRFNVNGELVDGQHRLFAIIDANEKAPFSAEFAVVRNVPVEAFVTMDTGRSRNFADILSIEFPDQPGLSITAAVTNAVYRWEIGNRGSALRSGHRAGNSFPNAVLLEFFREHKEEITELTRLAHRVINGVRGYTPTAVATTAWAVSRTEDSTEDVKEFFDRLQDGQGLVEGDPIFAARRTGENTWRNSEKVKNVLPMEMGVAYLIKAWNAYRKGEEVHQLKFRIGGAKPESFPEPV